MNLNQPNSCLFSTSIDFNSSDYLNIFSNKIYEDKYKVFLENISSGFSFLGIDIACSTEIKNLEQSTPAIETIKQLHSNMITFGDVDPLLIFVQSFSQSKNIYPWSNHPIASYVIPRYQLIQCDNKTSLVVTCLGQENDNRKILHKNLTDLINKFIRSLNNIDEVYCEINHLVSEKNNPYHNSYKNKFETIMQKLKNESTNKVVLSRMKELTMEKKINVASQMKYLRKDYSSCLNFLFSYPDLGAFIGSTPETLIKYNNRTIEADALAGTSINNSGNYQEPINELVDSDKNNEEHKIVLDYIIEKLTPLCESISYSKKPSILKLKNVDHLLSKVEGSAKQSFHLLDLVNKIHPTPAISGNPIDTSLKIISTLEDHSRGWYAGPIGWVDKNGYGEAKVALRSCLVNDRKAFLFSGSGIVNKSELIKEWEETELKFLPMLNSLKTKKIYE